MNTIKSKPNSLNKSNKFSISNSRNEESSFTRGGGASKVGVGKNNILISNESNNTASLLNNTNSSNFKQNVSTSKNEIPLNNPNPKLKESSSMNSNSKFPKRERKKYNSVLNNNQNFNFNEMTMKKFLIEQKPNASVLNIKNFPMTQRNTTMYTTTTPSNLISNQFSFKELGKHHLLSPLNTKFSDGTTNYYNEFKMSNLKKRNTNCFDSFLQKVNGSTPLLKYNLPNILNCIIEIEKYDEYFTSYEIFVNLFSKKSSDVEFIEFKENFYYDIKCCLNDFKTLVNQQLITNKLLRSHQRLSGKYSINEIYSIIPKIAQSICPCEKILVFLLNKKEKEYVSILSRESKKEFKISVEDGFIKKIQKDKKVIVLDQAMNNHDFPSGFKEMDKFFDINSSSIMLVPMFINTEDNEFNFNFNNTNYMAFNNISSTNLKYNNQSNNNLNISISNSNLNSKYNLKSTANQDSKYLIGFVYFINKKQLNEKKLKSEITLNQELKEFKENEMSNDYLSTKPKKQEQTEIESKDFSLYYSKMMKNYNKNTFTKDDESVCGLFSKQATNLICMTYELNQLANQEYKLQKSLFLIQRITTEKPEFLFSILIANLKKLFLTNNVQIIIPCEVYCKINTEGDDYDKKVEFNYLRILDGKELKINSLCGIVSYVMNSKHYLFVNNCKDNTIYNPMIDLEGCETLFTFPLTNLESQQVSSIIQIEYLPMRVPWDNDSAISGLFPFDNDIIEMISPSIKTLLEKTDSK